VPPPESVVALAMPPENTFSTAPFTVVESREAIDVLLAAAAGIEVLTECARSPCRRPRPNAAGVPPGQNDAARHAVDVPCLAAADLAPLSTPPLRDGFQPAASG
jgi:hypothetical protein